MTRHERWAGTDGGGRPPPGLPLRPPPVSGAAYLSGLLLAAVFAVAGGAKLLRPGATAAALADLAMPAPTVLSRALPVLELALSLTLVAAPRAGAVAALAALSAFTAVVVRALRAGASTTCGCFGSPRSEPLSFVEVVRNALLGALAAATLGAAHPVAPRFEAVVLVTSAAVAGALVLALCDLRRRMGAVWATTGARP